MVLRKQSVRAESNSGGWLSVGSREGLSGHGPLGWGLHDGKEPAVEAAVEGFQMRAQRGPFLPLPRSSRKPLSLMGVHLSFRCVGDRKMLRSTALDPWIFRVLILPDPAVLNPSILPWPPLPTYDTMANALNTFVPSPPLNWPPRNPPCSAASNGLAKVDSPQPQILFYYEILQIHKHKKRIILWRPINQLPRLRKKILKVLLNYLISLLSLPVEPVILHLVFIIPTGSDFNPGFKVEGSRLNICTSYFLISFPLPHTSVLWLLEIQYL